MKEKKFGYKLKSNADLCGQHVVHFAQKGSGGNSRITFKWSDRFKDKANTSPSKYMIYAIERFVTEVRFKKKSVQAFTTLKVTSKGEHGEVETETTDSSYFYRVTHEYRGSEWFGLCMVSFLLENNEIKVNLAKLH